MQILSLQKKRHLLSTKEYENVSFVQFQKLIKIRTDQQNLPIYQFKSDIIETIRQNQVVVVAGDTGCGKSTQVCADYVAFYCF